MNTTNRCFNCTLLSDPMPVVTKHATVAGSGHRARSGLLQRLPASVAVLSLATLLAQAQVSPPGQFNYQGQLLTATGTNIANGNYDLVFRIYNTQSAGSLLWGPATNLSVPVVGGFFNVVLGPIDNVNSNRSLVNVFASNQTAYLEIQVGTNTPITPRQQVLTAPYAFNADKLGGYGWDALGGSPANVALRTGGNTFTGDQAITAGNVGIGTATPSYPLTVRANVASRPIAWERYITGIQTGKTWAWEVDAAGNYLRNVTDNSIPLTILNGGNVGIGTASPASTLHVNGTVTASTLVGSYNAANLTGTVQDARLSGNVALRGGANNFSGNQTISGGGNMGLGTGSPVSRLDVRGTINCSAQGVFLTSGVQNSWPNTIVLQSAWNGQDYVEMKVPGASANSASLVLYANSGLYVNGAFVSSSDRNAKQNIKSVDVCDVLAKVASLPISRWSFKVDKDTEHMGPMAQDFRSAFGLGPDDKHIATVDADGVALAAIQGLNQKLEETRSELKRRDAENVELRQRLERLERILIQKQQGEE